MGMTPNCVAAYLKASFRNDARQRIADAMVAGYVHLPTESQRSLANMWALQARGEKITEESMNTAAGIVSVSQENIVEWIQQSHAVSHGD